MALPGSNCKPNGQTLHLKTNLAEAQAIVSAARPKAGVA